MFIVNNKSVRDGLRNEMGYSINNQYSDYLEISRANQQISLCTWVAVVVNWLKHKTSLLNILRCLDKCQQVKKVLYVR